MRKYQLFLFHFAGGNCYSFRFMEEHFNEFEFIPLELPGRGRRMSEPLLNDFGEAVRDLYDQVSHRIKPGRTLIYGHSMGALLALSVTHQLEKAGLFPDHLVVSGNAGPGIEGLSKKYLLEKEQFKQELKELGGLPMEVFSSDDLFDFFEPIIRTDFCLVENRNDYVFTPVRTPVYAIMGSEEKHTGEIHNWKHFTRARFRSEILTGDHFFIYRHSQRIAEIIKNCCSPRPKSIGPGNDTLTR